MNKFKFLKVITSMFSVALAVIMFISPSMASAASKSSNVFNELKTVNEKSIHSISNKINQQLSKEKSKLKKDVLENYNVSNEPRVYEYNDEIFVYYDLSSTNLISDFSFIQFVIDKESETITNSFSFITNKENEFNRVQVYNYNKEIANFQISENSDLGEGWVLDVSTNEKKDVKDVIPSNSFDVKVKDENKPSLFGWNWNCINRCYDNYNVPTWVIDAVNIVMAGSCLLGPNPVPSK